ncbi:MAG: DAK2 domain-containing protein [Firmicutes bacterium]|nr:DAK2 domain-containing protein [Bacillota bacterium]
MLSAGTTLLHEHKEEGDALNVFPVPDGDTGTNMYLTFLAALREAEKVAAKFHLGRVVEAAAQGALMGARGNSGVIVSQLFRGFAKAVAGAEGIDRRGLVAGLQGAVNMAYQAVRKPVEGTILTVAREAAKAAEAALRRGGNLVEFWEEVCAHAALALAKTPEMLPILAQAGVVDAGGKGLVVFMEGTLRALKGEEVVAAVSPTGTIAGASIPVAPGEDEPIDLTYRYCTEFLLRGRNLNPEQIKVDLAPHGDCLMVVGDEKMVKIHLHTNNPGLILDYAVRLGEMSEIQINNMVEQSQQRLERLKQARSAEAETTSEPKEIGIVAVAMGDGLAQIFRSLGVDEVVEGGQTMNPSAEDLLRSVERVAAKQVLILPNNGNVIMTAGQVSELTELPVAVAPSKSIPQGIAALMAFNPSASLEENLMNMTRALEEVKTGEVTYAVRASNLNGLAIKEGDIIGLVEDELVAAGQKPTEVLQQILDRMVDKEDALISIYYGRDVEEEEAREALATLVDRFPAAEIELYYGGQPLYYYIVSVE